MCAPGACGWYRSSGGQVSNPAPVSPSVAVREFHETFGLPIAKDLIVHGTKLALMRATIQLEEVSELATAISGRDVVGVADALADIVYVAFGTALVYGIDLDAVIDEVHASNMSKLGEDGKPVLRGDGKVVKGPNYRKPDIASALGLW